ncbi:LysR family transcriptional regulator [Aurantiacibacter xanthus]|uniref:LysR family transcriptional regulator n=1 Tax=Aurantiacibacter xanthus TaxID=1784712 RepID=A0A3A1NYT0_9SPHN|nr:LysR family transcriptional regulator [Aurantiacibacter xanthus]RIV80625.1 LysR family transcriptional regulator [Aurantiacibacter xanthus]
MKHDQLLALEAIVTTGTFRGAAERLNKSQSAISHTIRQLEEELELTLFSRDSYRPQLTAEGRVFYREASRVLVQMRDLGATAARLRAREEPELRLAITATLPLEPLLPVLSAIGQEFPATHLRLSTEMMGGPIARLMQGRADLAIATLDGVPVDEVETRRLAEVIIRPVACSRMAAELGPEMLSVSRMQAIPQIIVAGTNGPEDSQSRDLLPGGRKWTVSDFHAKRQVILAGQGWGGMPDHLIQADLAARALVALAVEGFPPRRSEIFAIRRRDQAPGPVATALWARLDEGLT